jgi:hypothetical protein
MKLDDNTIKTFKKFWQSKEGKEIREKIEDFKNDWLENSMMSTTSEQIQYYVARSAGVASILQYLDGLCELSKKGGHDQDSE